MLQRGRPYPLIRTAGTLTAGEMPQLNLPSPIPDQKKPYIEDLCTTKGYNVIYGFNTKTSAKVPNGVAICLPSTFEYTNCQAVVFSEKNDPLGFGTVALVVVASRIQDKQVFLIVCSHMDRGTQQKHIQQIVTTLGELKKTHPLATIIWGGDFNLTQRELNSYLNGGDLQIFDGYEKGVDMDAIPTQSLSRTRVKLTKFENTNFQEGSLIKKNLELNCKRADHLITNSPTTERADHLITNSPTTAVYSESSNTFPDKEEDELEGRFKQIQAYGSDHAPIEGTILMNGNKVEVVSFNILAKAWITAYGDNGRYYWDYNEDDDLIYNILLGEQRREKVKAYLNFLLDGERVLLLQEVELDEPFSGIYASQNFFDNKTKGVNRTDFLNVINHAGKKIFSPTEGEQKKTGGKCSRVTRTLPYRSRLRLRRRNTRNTRLLRRRNTRNTRRHNTRLRRHNTRLRRRNTRTTRRR